MKVFVAALVSICLSVVAQFLLKIGVTALKAPSIETSALQQLALALRNVPLVAGFGLYAAGAVIWLYVLYNWDVSRAYPLVGLGFALTALVGYFIANEQIGASRLIGIALICLGALVVARD